MKNSLTKFQYGLAIKKTGAILTYYVSSNDGCSDCGDTKTTLEDPRFGGQQWLVDELWKAEWVRTHSTPWYNSNYDKPTHYFNPDYLVVVKITSTVQIEEADISTLASDEEILRYAWRNQNYDTNIRTLNSPPFERPIKQFLHEATDYYRVSEYYMYKDKEKK